MSETQVVTAGSVRFQVPLEYEDRTDYTYGHPASPESLTVSLEPSSPDSASIEARVAEHLEQLRYVPARITSPPHPTLLGPWRALEFHFILEDGEAPSAFRCCVGELSPEAHLKLLYVAPTDRVSQQELFEHVKASARLRDPAGDGSGSPGFVRRDAASVSLELPAELRPPARYSFVSTTSRSELHVVADEPVEQREAEAPSEPLLLTGEAVEEGTLAVMAHGANFPVDRRVVAEAYRGGTRRWVLLRAGAIVAGHPVALKAQGPLKEETALVKSLQVLITSLEPLTPNAR